MEIMDAALSKTINETQDDISETKFPSASILTSQTRKLDIDPRSPTTNICRTPIQVSKTPLHKNVTNCHKDKNILDLSGIDFDPRSPTLDFQRTPVDAKRERNMQPNHLHNKILDNARKPLMSLTPFKPKKSNSRTNCDNKSLLETSTTFKKKFENKRNRFICVLDTNIDCGGETGIDIAIQQKTSSQGSEIEETTSEQNENTAIPLKLSINDMKELPEHVEESGYITKWNAELDGKLTNLIYEDKVIESTVKISKTIRRIPLGDRNANNEHQGAIPVLKVNDKLTKMNTNSKIPVFKGNKIEGEHVQCENTPPRIIKCLH